MYDLLINTSDLKEAISTGDTVHAEAERISGVDGFVLRVRINDERKTLSTYLSDKPRLFKRSDALLKEARKLGLTSITFDLTE